jgi:hypothetical protein
MAREFGSFKAAADSGYESLAEDCWTLSLCHQNFDLDWTGVVLFPSNLTELGRTLRVILRRPKLGAPAGQS